MYYPKIHSVRKNIFYFQESRTYNSVKYVVSFKYNNLYDNIKSEQYSTVNLSVWVVIHTLTSEHVFYFIKKKIRLWIVITTYAGRDSFKMSIETNEA